MSRKIMLCDVNFDMIDAWVNVFGTPSDNGVAIWAGPFQRLLATNPDGAFVMCTAGNSFGVMGGGIDAQIRDYFVGCEEQIQAIIQTECSGILPVGVAVALDMTDIDKHMNVDAILYVPTMLAPMPINGTFNVYLATMAALREYDNYVDTYISGWHDGVEHTLVMPGFGGACGMVPPMSVARQMKLAIDHYDSGHYPNDEKSMGQFMLALRKAVRG